jgi:hypothetical protein
MLRRHGQKIAIQIHEDSISRLADRKMPAGFELTIDVPERIVRGLRPQREHNQFRLPEFQPEAGRLGKTGIVALGRNLRVDPAMFANYGDEILLVLIEHFRRRVESREHGWGRRVGSSRQVGCAAG